MEKVKLSFEISKDAFELLKQINEKGSAEYRDLEWPTLNDFKRSDVFLEGRWDEEWFLERNFNGTSYLIDELYNFGLVDTDGESWHLTYVVTGFGKEVLK